MGILQFQVLAGEDHLSVFLALIGIRLSLSEGALPTLFEARPHQTQQQQAASQAQSIRSMLSFAFRSIVSQEEGAGHPRLLTAGMVELAQEVAVAELPQVEAGMAELAQEVAVAELAQQIARAGAGASVAVAAALAAVASVVQGL